MTLNYSFCAEEGFNVTSEKTIFTSSIAEAINMFETYTNKKIDSACYRQSKFFFCGRFFPKCEQGRTLQYPCKNYCRGQHKSLFLFIVFLNIYKFSKKKKCNANI